MPFFSTIYAFYTLCIFANFCAEHKSLQKYKECKKRKNMYIKETIDFSSNFFATI
jgi:hypothetical protein